MPSRKTERVNGLIAPVMGHVDTRMVERVYDRLPLQMTVTGPFELVDYRKLDPIGFGAAMGAGAMLGELFNSFVKRQLDIAPGATTTGSARIPSRLFHR